MKLRLIFFVALLTFALQASDSGASKIEEKGISGQEALSILQKGNERFVSGNMEHAQQNDKDRATLTTGQKPYAIIISCSDSRVPPEIIFDQGLGQLFVVRSAGEVLSQAGIASVEYALEHLGTELIVILGHESCGAVKAALSTPVGKSTGSANLDGLIASIRPNIKNAHTADDLFFVKAGKAQVNGVARTLVDQSKIVREFATKGKLTLALGIYSLNSGKVDYWSMGIPIVVERRIPAVVKIEREVAPEISLPTSHHRKY